MQPCNEVQAEVQYNVQMRCCAVVCNYNAEMQCRRYFGDSVQCRGRVGAEVGEKTPDYQILIFCQGREGEVQYEDADDNVHKSTNCTVLLALVLY